ncbi:MAG: hypothetical protein HY059_17785 [Proteobacteria bacterium]|nr:hypothetical protein [Pseudomonadota bacterium]
MIKYLFATVIWGDAYVDEFLERSLPTQICYENLGSVPDLSQSRYLFLTTAADIKRMKRSPIIRRLSTMLDVQFHPIDDIPRHNKYIGCSLAQGEALRVAAADGFDAIFFLYPDFICAAGSIANAAKRIAEGYDGVFFPIPAVLDTLYADPAYNRTTLEARVPDGPVVTIPPRLLVELSTRHGHNMLKGYFLEGDQHNLGPAYLLWNIPREGWLIHAFHLHPCVIRVQRDNPDFFAMFDVSLDEEFVPRLFKTTDRLYFPSDSDEIAMCSLRTPQSDPQPLPGRPRQEKIVQWAEEYASLVHREFVHIPYRWHYAPVTRAMWDVQESKAARLIRRITDRLRVPDAVLQYEDPLCFHLRQIRKNRFHARWLAPTSIPTELLARRESLSPLVVDGPSAMWRMLTALKRALGLGSLRRFPMLLGGWKWLHRQLNR